MSILVDALFVGPKYVTDLWVSEDVADAIGQLQKAESGRFLKKLEYYARAGFNKFESTKGPIKHEWDEVYRVAHGNTQFRMIGFYPDWPKEFVAIDTFLKHKQKLSKSERECIDKVAQVKQDNSWEKR